MREICRFLPLDFLILVIAVSVRVWFFFCKQIVISRSQDKILRFVHTLNTFLLVEKCLKIIFSRRWSSILKCVKKSYLCVIVRHKSLQSLKRPVRILQVYRVDGVRQNGIADLQIIKRWFIVGVVIIFVRNVDGVAVVGSRRHRVCFIDSQMRKISRSAVVRNNVRQYSRIVPRIEARLRFTALRQR